MAQVAGEGYHWTGPEGTGSGLDSFDTLHSLGSLHPGPPNHQNYLNTPRPSLPDQRDPIYTMQTFLSKPSRFR